VRAAAEAEAARPKVGTTVELDGWRYVVTKASKPGRRINLNSLSHAEASGQFILVQMTVTNLEDKTDYRATWDFKLTDSVGDKIPVTSYLGLGTWFSKQLGAHEIDDSMPPRTTHQTAMLFDAPADAKGLQLVVSAASWTASPSQMVIDLGL
jgi:Domain of unknown function (DUF4352)